MYKIEINKNEYSFYRVSRKDKKKIKKIIAKDCNLKKKSEITKYFINYITFGIKRNIEVKKSNEYTEKLLKEGTR